MRSGHRLCHRYVDVEGKSTLNKDRKNFVVFGLERQSAMRPRQHHGAADTRTISDSLNLCDRFFDSPIRDPHNCTETFRGIRSELRDPIVVGPHHGVVIVRIAVCGDCCGETRCRIQHFGVDAVEVHFSNPSSWVVAPGPHVLKAHPTLHLFRREPSAGIHAEIDGIIHAFDDPRIAFLESLHTRGTFLHGRGNTVDPQRARFVEVTVCRNQSIATTSGGCIARD